jgi:hypothetical protein
MTPLDQDALRAKILETLNLLVALEGGPVAVTEVRIVPAPAFLDQTYGTSILLEDGSVAVRIAVQRPLPQVADTVLHETAHVLLGPEHVDRPDHGPEFQRVYQGLREKYSDVVMEMLGPAA